jgi:hypothetical protein
VFTRALPRVVWRRRLSRKARSLLEPARREPVVVVPVPPVPGTSVRKRGQPSLGSPNMGRLLGRMEGRLRPSATLRNSLAS